LDALIVVLLVVVAALFVALYRSNREVKSGNLAKKEQEGLKSQIQRLEDDAAGLKNELSSLAKFTVVRDAAAEAERLVREAREFAAKSETEAQRSRQAAKEDADRIVRAAEDAAAKAHARAMQDRKDAQSEAERLIRETRESAARFQAEAQRDRQIAQADAERIIRTAQEAAAQDRMAAQSEADLLRKSAMKEARDRREATDKVVAEAGLQASKIIDEATRRAEAIAGDAYRAMQQADQIAATVQAMKNVIEGYGDKYMVPTHSLLDDLAEAYSHTDAGQDLKRARERSRLMVSQDRAATCEYVCAVHGMNPVGCKSRYQVSAEPKVSQRTTASP
jgi:hypothetical protein